MVHRRLSELEQKNIFVGAPKETANPQSPVLSGTPAPLQQPCNPWVNFWIWELGAVGGGEDLEAWSTAGGTSNPVPASFSHVPACRRTPALASLATKFIQNLWFQEPTWRRSAWA